MPRPPCRKLSSRRPMPRMPGWRPTPACDLAAGSAPFPLRGPLGHGFHVPATAHRVALAALDQSFGRLLPLIDLALEQGAAVALCGMNLPAHLPSAVEVLPLDALPELARLGRITWRWTWPWPGWGKSSHPPGWVWRRCDRPGSQNRAAAAGPHALRRPGGVRYLRRDPSGRAGCPPAPPARCLILHGSGVES